MSLLFANPKDRFFCFEAHIVMTSYTLRQKCVTACDCYNSISVYFEYIKLKKITLQMRIGPGLPQQNQRVNNSSTTKKQEHSGSVVECLTLDRKAAGSTLTGVTVL